MSTFLTSEDLYIVYTATFSVRAKWRNLSLALGLDYPTIESIGVKWRDNPDDCYREGLFEWLKGGERSWRDLAKALSSPPVGYTDLAKKIVKTQHIKAKSSMQFSIKWRSQSDLPIKTGRGIQSVLIGGVIYVGGGDALNDHHRSTVMKFDDSWSKLPQYNAVDFCLVSAFGKLVLLGGQNIVSRGRTNRVSSFEHNTWTDRYPPLQKARSFSTAISFDSYIVVAGGINDQGMITASVEVYDITQNLWKFAESLPNPRDQMSPVVVESVLYLMGGVELNTPHSAVTRSRAVLKVNVAELVKGTRQEECCSIWKSIEDTPFAFSAPVCIKDYLFAIGGHDSCNPSSSIHFYQPDTRSWVKVGELPTARYGCTCSVLSSGEIIVAGGKLNRRNFVSIVDILNVSLMPNSEFLLLQ